MNKRFCCLHDTKDSRGKNKNHYRLIEKIIGKGFTFKTIKNQCNFKSN